MNEEEVTLGSLGKQIRGSRKVILEKLDGVFSSAVRVSSQQTKEILVLKEVVHQLVANGDFSDEKRKELWQKLSLIQKN